MSLYKNKYRIESNRLQNWDYSSKAIYFITFCSLNREYIFGNIDNERMILNDWGKILEKEIKSSIVLREKWDFHNLIIMPNHVHFLIEIKDENPKFNYSTKRILNDTISLEIHNLYLNKGIIIEEKNLSSSQQPYKLENLEVVNCGSPQQKKEEIFNFVIEETNCSLPQQGVNHFKFEETNGSYSQPNGEISNLIIEEKNGISSQQGIVDFKIEVTNCSLPQQGVNHFKFEETNGSYSQLNGEISNFIIEEKNGISSQQGIVDFKIEETNCSLSQQQPLQNSNFFRRPKSISSFVGVIKSKVTSQVQENSPVKNSIWQANYHDHIVRNEEEFKAIFYYIKNNPKNWDKDSLK